MTRTYCLRKETLEKELETARWDERNNILQNTGNLICNLKCGQRVKKMVPVLNPSLVLISVHHSFFLLCSLIIQHFIQLVANGYRFQYYHVNVCWQLPADMWREEISHRLFVRRAIDNKKKLELLLLLELLLVFGHNCHFSHFSKV